jgi:hypothetical protein
MPHNSLKYGHIYDCNTFLVITMLGFYEILKYTYNCSIVTYIKY